MPSDLTKCNQKPACANPPAYRFTWAGHDEGAVCEEHGRKLAGIAAAMGYYCQLIPLDGMAFPGDGRDGYTGPVEE